MFEQFAGIAYLAVVVSRLIGMTIHRRSKKSWDRDTQGNSPNRQVPESAGLSGLTSRLRYHKKIKGLA